MVTVELLTPRADRWVNISLPLHARYPAVAPSLASSYVVRSAVGLRLGRRGGFAPQHASPRALDNSEPGRMTHGAPASHQVLLRGWGSSVGWVPGTWVIITLRTALHAHARTHTFQLGS